MKLVIIGIQGSGKSTQGDLLSKRFGIPFISAGSLLRGMAKEETVQGKHIKELIDSGMLLPDDEIVPIIHTYLEQSQYKNGYIIDGFPRSVRQAKMFSPEIDKAIFLNIPEKESYIRIAARNDKSRHDETEAGIKKRISLFNEITAPVIHYYEAQGKLISVDGTQTIQQVNNDIVNKLVL